MKFKLIPFVLVGLTFWTMLVACGSATSVTALPTVALSTAAPAAGTPTTLAQPTASAQATAPASSGATTAAAMTDAPSATQTAATDSPTTSSPAPTGSASSGNFTLDIEPYIKGLNKPVFVTTAGDSTDRLFIVQQTGQILIAENGKVNSAPFLDISDKITTEGNEQGLLGLAFSPNYAKDGRFFVNYSAKANGDNIIERYQVSGDANAADKGSAKTLLTIPGFEPNHNSGMLAFGPDGFLYIGAGDGGGGGDQHGTIGNGQDLNALNGKILRIDVSGDAYTVPPSNPFVGQANVKPEIWAYGLRNPWRFSFDRATGDLYIADVGQDKYEEVNFQPAGDKGGENYGWRLMEATHCYNPSTNCDTGNLVKPVTEYPHDFGCSITGGYVYRGQQYPWLVGTYIFADYCTGNVWTLARDANGAWQTKQLTKFDDQISSFGQDAQGELYVAGWGSGTIYKLTSAQ